MDAQDTRALWQQEHEAVVRRMRDGGGKAGLARPEQVAGKTGLQVMQAMLAGELPYPHMADRMRAEAHVGRQRHPNLATESTQPATNENDPSRG